MRLWVSPLRQERANEVSENPNAELRNKKALYFLKQRAFHNYVYNLIR
jgi:hypothetical protein